jgi:hypothetical protein
MLITASPLLLRHNLSSRFARLVLLEILFLGTVDKRSTIFVATGRTTIRIRPASVIRSPAGTIIVASHVSTGIITQGHERRTGVSTVAARRTATFVASVIRGTGTDAARRWNGSCSWDQSCYPISRISRLGAEVVARAILNRGCMKVVTIIIDISLSASVHRVEAPAVFI